HRGRACRSARPENAAASQGFAAPTSRDRNPGNARAPAPAGWPGPQACRTRGCYLRWQKARVTPSCGWSFSRILGAPLPKPSVLPGIARPGRRTLCDGFCHDPQQPRLVQRGPAMALHRPAVFERPAKGRAAGAAKKILKLVDGQIEVEVVHVAAIKMQLP